jgi:biotin carboxyl carrier protein
MPSKSIFETFVNQLWVPVSVERLANQAIVHLPEYSVQVDFTELAAGTYSVLIDGRSYDVALSFSKGRYRVSVSGSLFEILLRDPKRLRNKTVQTNDSTGPISVSVPMPGKVVKLLVQEGQKVSEGQGVAVVEAMKMQNELKAPKSGTVEGIQVTENQAVNAGESLLVVR